MAADESGGDEAQNAGSVERGELRRDDCFSKQQQQQYWEQAKNGKEGERRKRRKDFGRGYAISRIQTQRNPVDRHLKPSGPGRGRPATMLCSPWKMGSMMTTAGRRAGSRGTLDLNSGKRSSRIFR